MLTGIVFGIIVIMWIAYLVPWMLSQRVPDISADPAVLKNFVKSMTIVRKGDEASADFLVDSGADISTPLMRRAARYHVDRAVKTAIKRRRQGLFIHLILLVVGIVVPFVTSLSHLWTILPGCMLVLWMVLSRISVVTMRQMVKRRYREIAQIDDEMTVVIQTDKDQPSDIAETERNIEITDQLVDTLGSLWEPIPVTPTTYLSRPLLPRSVRTIDLSAPVASSELHVPVTVERGSQTSHLDQASGQ